MLTSSEANKCSHVACCFEVHSAGLLGQFFGPHWMIDHGTKMDTGYLDQLSSLAFLSYEDLYHLNVIIIITENHADRPS